MSPNNNSSLHPEEIPPAGKEYRLKKVYLVLGMGGMVFFTVMDIWTLDPADMPMSMIMIGSFVWSFMFILSAYVILAYHRERLYINPDSVRLKGCFRTREIHFHEVNRAVWRSFFYSRGQNSPPRRQGELVLYDANGKAKVSLGNYAVSQRDLARFFRVALAGHDQEGWERFEEMYILNKYST